MRPTCEDIIPASTMIEPESGVRLFVSVSSSVSALPVQFFPSYTAMTGTTSSSSNISESSFGLKAARADG